jgi:sigma-B regulation protein RsbU (phosphoserine phosphatase)
MSAKLEPVTGMKEFLGIGFWRFQLLLLAMGIAVIGVYWLILGPPNSLQRVFEPLVFPLTAGNFLALSLNVTSPIYSRKTFPKDLLLYIAILIPVSVAGGLLASVAEKLMFEWSADSLFRFDWSSVRMSTFISVVTGIPIYVARKGRVELERRNLELESQITRGRIELEAQEAEIKAAHDIQAHLLPREIPKVKGFEVACAWQPAKSVGGDYFDVMALVPGQLAVCLADVSGKGISAALLMANLQATVRAFAPGIAGPGALCRKINEVLCGSIAPGKFVTFFYGTIDAETLTLRFENAGHSQPIVLRGESTTTLTEGGTVLGLFPNAQYEERSFALQSADCLLLTTDGVTEAANESDEEFGDERVTASARAARDLGAHGIRTRILEDVTRFCNGNFHDDASLIVVTVD